MAKLTKADIKKSATAKRKLGTFIHGRITDVIPKSKGYYQVCYKEADNKGENCILVSYQSKNPRHKNFDILG